MKKSIHDAAIKALKAATEAKAPTDKTSEEARKLAIKASQFVNPLKK